jgi:thiamine biosynthesis lipoprotein
MIKTYGYILFLFSFILTLVPYPAYPSDLYRFQQVAMGTVIEITLMGDNEEAAHKAALRAFQEVKRIEQLMSPWIESADVFRINRSSGKERVKISPETLEVIKKAQEISELSDGRFDITVGPLVEVWRKAREKKIPPFAEEVKEKLSLVNFKNIEIDRE